MLLPKWTKKDLGRFTVGAAVSGVVFATVNENFRTWLIHNHLDAMFVSIQANFGHASRWLIGQQWFVPVIASIITGVIMAFALMAILYALAKKGVIAILLRQPQPAHETILPVPCQESSASEGEASLT